MDDENFSEKFSKKKVSTKHFKRNLHFSSEKNSVLFNDYFFSVFVVENYHNLSQLDVGSNKVTLKTKK